MTPHTINARHYYNAPFKREDHQRLADLMRQIKGRCIISINDLPETREIYGKGMNVNEISLLYTASPAKNREVTELLVGNYDV